MGLVVVDNHILVMEERHCLAAFKSLKIDVERLLIDPSRFVIIICIYNIFQLISTKRRNQIECSLKIAKLTNEVKNKKIPVKTVLKSKTQILGTGEQIAIAYRPIAFCNYNLYQRRHTLYPFGMSILVFHFFFCSFSGIILNGIQKKSFNHTLLDK
jgi:hypothetical protein